MNFGETLRLVLQDAFWSGVAAVGFAVLFNVPRRTLTGCFLCGAMGHAVRTLLMQTGGSIEGATLAGALTVGSLAFWMARHGRAPKAVYSISGAIPLVPGSFAYRAMIGLITVTTADPASSGTLLTAATINGIRTALILGAIAVGIAAPNLLFERRKPVV